MTASYPIGSTDRDSWILSRRSARNPVDPFRPYAFLPEEERAESGEIVPVATIFLTNRECPWKCVMCDLWKNTLAETVPIGAIPAQIEFALHELERAAAPWSANRQHAPGTAAFQPPQLGTAGKPSLRTSLEARAAFRQIKLYNSGSFFDPQAVPVEDYGAIADRVRPFERVIVECHPGLIGERCLRFRDLLDSGGVAQAGRSPMDRSSRREEALTASTRIGVSLLTPAATGFGGREKVFQSLDDSRGLADSPLSRAASTLEVAMGLETANPEVLARLNKRLTLDAFSRAADFLRTHGIALRVFILVQPPFLAEAESLHWAERSLEFAFQCGATAASLIPTRLGNGAMESLAKLGQFSPPKLAMLEAALACGLRLKKGRVFADTWDLERFSNCAACFPARAERLRQMNLGQEILPEIACIHCHSGGKP